MPDQAVQPALQDRPVLLSLRHAKPIRRFLADRKGTELSLEQCGRIVQEVISSLQGIYVHLPAKRATYAVDPVRRLQLLQMRIDAWQHAEAVPPEGDLWFFRELIDALTSVRDMHTGYVLPPPFENAIAFVPFQIEAYADAKHAQRYVVTNLIDGLGWFPVHTMAGFREGAVVTHWNDVPIERAAELAGARNPGSNPRARLARGLARLTIRPLGRALPPDEEWVTVTYHAAGGGPERQMRAEWRVAVLDGAPPQTDGRRVEAEGFHDEADTIRQVRKFMYSPLYGKVRGESGLKTRAPSAPAAGKEVSFGDPMEVPPGLQDICEAQQIVYRGETLGYIHLRSFKPDPDVFIPGLQTILGQAPPRGLVLDIRGNPGGNVSNAERLLQFFTPHGVVPMTAQFINTPLSLKLAGLLHERYGDWLPSMREAAESGATYSRGFPLTSMARCNDFGQIYYGPVVLITDALCYSAADIFAAGFVDNGVGSVVGIDGTTGAGGADVVLHSDLCRRLDGVLAGAASPLTALPAGDLRVALRRTLRVGLQSGAALEDVGVVSTPPHPLTRDDVLHGNVDLLREAARRVLERPAYVLAVEPDTLRVEAGQVSVTLETAGLDRLDLAFDDGWALPSQAVEAKTVDIVAPIRPGAAPGSLRVRGFAAGELKAACRVALDAVRSVRADEAGVDRGEADARGR